MQELKVAVLQCNLHWCNPSANLAHLEELIWSIKEPVDLILLPEMFTTGFAMEAEQYAEHPNGTTGKWLKMVSDQTQAMIAGSIMVKEGRDYFNRLLMVTPEGGVCSYDKRHLFGMAGESLKFSKGKRREVVNFREWRLMPQICYDLRFPVFSRNNLNYDLLFYVANWPSPRINAWQKLITARAIENQSYCIGVNRVGIDGKGHEYPGNSMIVDPMGETLYLLDSQEQIKTVTLNKQVIKNCRDNLPFLKDADQFHIEI